MAEDTLRILQMVSDGKITAQEAEKLLAAIESAQPQAVSQDESPLSKAFADKFLYVKVEPKEGKSSDRVSVKIPFALFKTGLNIVGLIPKNAQKEIQSSMEKSGITLDLNAITPENVQELMSALEEMKIDVDAEDATIQVYCR